MTRNRNAITTLAWIVIQAENHYNRRIHFLVESAIKWLVVGKDCYVVNLSTNEQTALKELGFSVFVVLPEARGKKDLCEVTIR